VRKGDFGAAVQVLELALQVCRTYAINQWFTPVAGSLGAAYAGLGRLDQAVPLLEECVAHGDRLGLGANNSLWLTYLGEAYLRAGRRSDALASAQRALAQSRQRKEGGFEAWAIQLLGEIGASGADPELDAAAARYHEALAIAEGRAMRPLAALCHHGLGTVLARQGNQAAAESHRQAASAEFQALDMRGPADSRDGDQRPRTPL
jgi:tetratricopeptide (TPR) repeat protein